MHELAAPTGASRATAAFAWRVVAFLWFAYLLNYIDRQVVFSIFPALRRDLLFRCEPGPHRHCLHVGVFILYVVHRRAADLIRRDRIVIASLLLWSGATFGTGLSGSVGLFLFWRAVMGVTESLYVPAALGLIAGVHDSATRSRALAVHAALSLLWSGWRAPLVYVRADTVVRWHHQRFRRFWTRLSRGNRRHRGRPAIAVEVRRLIERMAKPNPLWRAPRISDGSLDFPQIVEAFGEQEAPR